MMIKKIIFFLILLLSINFSYAAEEKNELLLKYKADNNINNKASLQRGAKYFVNYCSGCHSLKYMRIKTLASDLGIDEESFLMNLNFSDKKIGETMTIAMNSSDAAEWFEAIPPDLSLVSRSKGQDYVFSLLNTYYIDDAKSTGFNNLTYPNTVMPHVLVSLQGEQNVKIDKENNPLGFEILSKGTLNKKEYIELTNDINNFLVYVSEPAKLKRQSIGVWVLIFLFIFSIVAYYTKKEYWNDVK